MMAIAFTLSLTMRTLNPNRRNLAHHIRGALTTTGPATSGSATPPPYEWLAHDDGVVLAVALALGHEALAEMAATCEAKGDLVTAALMSWAASKLATRGLDLC